MARLLSVDPETKSWEEFEYDEDSDKIRIWRRQDVTNVIDINKKLQNEDHDRKETMWHAASIPDIIVHKWLNEDGVNILRKENWPWLRRKLNDPDWQWLRAGRFKV